MSDPPRPPLPPFTEETARTKVRAAEDAWNGRNPSASRWPTLPTCVAEPVGIFPRPRSDHGLPHPQVDQGTGLSPDQGILDVGGKRIAVRFAYEWRDDSGHWFRSYGNENWEFDERGLMCRRIASINDLPIAAEERKFHSTPGSRPADHPGLSDLGL